MACRIAPRIGVTGPDRGGLAMWLFAWLGVALAGGRAVRIRPGAPRKDIPLDGLIIGGGADVDPALYGEEPGDFLDELNETETTRLEWLLGLVFYPLLWLVRKLVSRGQPISGDPARDGLETRLLTRALEADIPVLGICRGAQLLNVVLGGTLHQELSSFYQETPQLRSALPRKPVRLEPETLLARVLDVDETRVNALHRQAIDRLGKGLVVAAREATGVIQAVELAGCGFVVGVQWHPEFLPHKPVQRRIFRALVAAAAGVRGNAGGSSRVREEDRYVP